MGKRSNATDPAQDPAVQSALAELRGAIAPFAKVIEAYGRSRPAADHAVLRIYGPNGAYAEVRFGDFLRLAALIEPPDSSYADQADAEDADPESADA